VSASGRGGALEAPSSNNVLGQAPGDVIRDYWDAIAQQRASREGQEGLQAFLEKRTPSWTIKD
jgi:hypothetical protein